MITKEQYLEALTTITEYGKQLNLLVVSDSFVDVIAESLLSDAGFYVQMSIKAETEEEERKQLELADKYYRAMEWLETLLSKNINVD